MGLAARRSVHVLVDVRSSKTPKMAERKPPPDPISSWLDTDEEDTSYSPPLASRASPFNEVNLGAPPPSQPNRAACVAASEPTTSRTKSPFAISSTRPEPRSLPKLDIGIAIGHPPAPRPPPEARASRFPADSDPDQRFGASRPLPGTAGGADCEEKDREPNAHRGRIWHKIRTWAWCVKDDLGWPEKHQYSKRSIGDTGIDMGHLQEHRKWTRWKSPQKATRRGNNSAMSGLRSRRDSSCSLHASTSASTLVSGSATPILGTGLDPYELKGALGKLHAMGPEKDTSPTKYLQAKAELGHRRNLVVLVVYALMAYGAPPYRLEEYVMQLFKVLDMEGRVNYTVGCMEISFVNPVDPADPMTRSAYTTLVKADGLDVGACEIAFHIYKDVVSGDMTADEATERLTRLTEEPPYHSPWFVTAMYGVASALSCVSASGGYWTDMLPAFFLGSIVGALQNFVAAKNPLYGNVLEVTASLITAFGARAFASIGGGGDQKYFCFGAIAQSSLVVILPGFMVLTGTLELQSKSITAGSTRLFYALIYSMFMGYGVTVGSQLWGTIYPDAPTSATCPAGRAVADEWKFILVPSFLVAMSFCINSRPMQLPIQVLIGSAAYATDFFASQYADGQIACTASALMLGVLGHVWARSQRAFAFAAVVTGIMPLVPGNLAAQGGIILGITTPLSVNSADYTRSLFDDNIYRSLSVGTQIMQVTVGLAVGVLLSALVVYPLGRKKNALLSF